MMTTNLMGLKREVEADGYVVARLTKNGGLEVRDFGRWVVPPEVRGEDREDYDWKEMDQKTRERVAVLAQKYGMDVQAQEKSWLVFTPKGGR